MGHIAKTSQLSTHLMASREFPVLAANYNGIATPSSNHIEAIVGLDRVTACKNPVIRLLPGMCDRSYKRLLIILLWL